MIENRHICICIVLIISVGGIFYVIPILRWAHIFVEKWIFGFTFIINGIETYHLLPKQFIVFNFNFTRYTVKLHEYI